MRDSEDLQRERNPGNGAVSDHSTYRGLVGVETSSSAPWSKFYIAVWTLCNSQTKSVEQKHMRAYYFFMKRNYLESCPHQLSLLCTLMLLVLSLLLNPQSTIGQAPASM